MIVRKRNGAELFVQISHKSFRNIGLIGRPDKDSVVETLCLIHDHLITLGLNPVFDQETAKLVPYSHGQTVSRNLLGEVVDLVIVVGGDGSLLHAARALVRAYRDWETDRKSTRLNSSHITRTRMPSSA